MRRILLLLTALIFNITAKAQFLSGIFSQNTTQLKYMVEQIAALKVYAAYLNKGYGIIKDGAGFIGDVKNGEFSLHRDYFHSLTTISPAVKKYSKAAAIYSMQSAMVREQENIGRLTSALPDMLASELKRTLSGIRYRSSMELDELLLILEDNSIAMTESGRIQAIDRIYNSMQQAYSFQKRLLKDTGDLIAILKRQSKDNTLYKKLY